jgi:hypothetical protein
MFHYTIMLNFGWTWFLFLLASIACVKTSPQVARDAGQLGKTDETSAQAAFQACHADPQPSCFEQIASRFSAATIAAKAREMAALLRKPATEQAAYWAEHSMTDEAEMLLRGFCHNRSVLIYEEANVVDGAIDGLDVALATRITLSDILSGHGYVFTTDYSRIGLPILVPSTLEKAGCTVTAWQEDDIIVDPITKRREVWRMGPDNGRPSKGPKREKFVVQHRLTDEIRANQDVVVVVKRRMFEHRKSSMGQPLRLTYEWSSQIRGKGDAKDRTVKDRYDFVEKKGFRIDDEAKTVAQTERKHQENMARELIAALAGTTSGASSVTPRP